MTYPSLTLPTLVSLVPKDIIAEIDACDEISYKVDYDKKKYDIIVISFDTSSSKQAYIHSKEFKKEVHILLWEDIIPLLYLKKQQNIVIL